MQVYRFREKRSGDRPCVVTIGNFDGMHLGHQALTGAVVNEAKERDLSSALVTFHPHPQEILHPRRPVQRICTCLLYTSPSPRDRTRSRMPSSA